MAYLTKQQVIDIINKAPQGTTPAGIVAALRQQGHQLEGYGTQSVTQTKKPGILKSVIDTTVGKKGLLGTVANVGNPINAALGLNTANQIGDARKTISSTSDFFLNLARNEKDPARRDKFLAQAKSASKEAGILGNQQGNIIDETAARTEQDVPTIQNLKNIAGTGLNAATTVGGFGIGPTKAATALGRIGKTGLQVGGLSAVGGAGTALTENKNAGDIIKNAITSGILGFFTGAALKSLGEAGKAVSKNTPKALYNTSIKPTLEENRKAIRYGGKTLGEELLDRGVAGSDKKLLKTSLANLDTNETKLQKILSGSNEVITRKDLSGYLDDLIVKKKATPGLADDIEKIKTVLQEYPESLPASQANVIKRNLYEALRDVAFKIDPSLTTKKEAMKALASGIKQEIEKKIGGETVKTLNKELSVYGRLYDRIVDKLARSQRNNLIGLGDFEAGILGGVTGGGPGAALAIAGRAAVGSTAVKTNAALAIKRVSDLIQKLPTDIGGRISKTAVIKLLNSLNANQGPQE